MLSIMVPDKATYKGDNRGTLTSHRAKWCEVFRSRSSGVLGLSKHSKDAAEGVNAIVGLAESLSLISLGPSLYRECRWEDATEPKL